MRGSTNAGSASPEISAQRDELRREYASLTVNEALRHQTARIEALAEQEPWIARLQAEIGELRAEIDKLEAESDAEIRRLGFTDSPAALPTLASGELRLLRPPARTLDESLGRMKQAKQEAATARADAESLDRQMQSALAALGESNLAQARERKTDAVVQFRRRSLCDEQIEQQTAYRTELDERCRRLVDRQLLPAGVLIGLGGVFVVGVMLLLTGLFMPASFVGTAGWTLAVLGLVGGGAAALGKVMLERSNAHQLDACRKQIELLREQIRQAREERDALEARLPGEGPIASRLQAAERELAAVEELAPLDSRREAARAEAEAVSRRAAEAREAVKAARRRCARPLPRQDCPRSMSPKQLRVLAHNGGRIADMQRRLNDRREELLRRRRELDSLSARIAQLAADAGLTSPLPLGVGPGMREASANSPLPLGEGLGVRAAGSGQWPAVRSQFENANPQSPMSGPLAVSPHPNPLPKGEGTFGFRSDRATPRWRRPPPGSRPRSPAARPFAAWPARIAPPRQKAKSRSAG